MDLSVIILSYNTRDITDKCLSRLQVAVDRLEKMGSKAEVIVLDNASSDGSVEIIKKNHPWATLIESKENTGYSKGNNIAVKRAKYPLILFLNSDVFVEDDTLVRSLEYFSNHNCDVLGVKLVYENGKLQPSAGDLPNPINSIFWILGLGKIATFHPKSPQFFSKEKKVGWVMGAFLLIKKEIFVKLGGFDEKIFMYMDEVDLCKRMNSHGLKVCFTPSIVVTHLHRASSKENPEIAFSKEIKGISYFLKKYYSNSYFLVKLILILGLILRIVTFSLIGQTKRAKAYLEGLRYV